MAFTPSPAFVQVNSAAPTGRASTTGVMLGLGATLVPQATGRIIVLATGIVANGTSGDGATFQLYYGSNAVPTNNEAVATAAGTAFGGLNVISSFVTTELGQSFAISGSFSVAAPQYLGTGIQPTIVTYWIDLNFLSSAGTVTFTTVNLLAWEI